MHVYLSKCMCVWLCAILFNMWLLKYTQKVHSTEHTHCRVVVASQIHLFSSTAFIIIKCTDGKNKIDVAHTKSRY